MGQDARDIGIRQRDLRLEGFLCHQKLHHVNAWRISCHFFPLGYAEWELFLCAERQPLHAVRGERSSHSSHYQCRGDRAPPPPSLREARALGYVSGMTMDATTR